METVFLIVDSVLTILLVFFDFMESKENKHLRQLCSQMDKAVTLLIEQNKELWKLSGVVAKGEEKRG